MSIDWDRNSLVDLVVVKNVGSNAAIVYWKICGWVNHNEKRKQNYHDGRYWAFNTKNAWQDHLMCFTTRQIRTALEKLIEAGLVVTGNYNDLNCDRTLWYSVNPVPEMWVLSWQKALDKKVHTARTKKSNGSDKKVQPIPIYKQSNNKLNNNALSNQFEELWKTINSRLVKSRQGEKQRAKNLFTRKAKEIDPEQLSTAIVAFYADPAVNKDGYRFAPAIAVCLSKERYTGYLGSAPSVPASVMKKLYERRDAGEITQDDVDRLASEYVGRAA